MVARETVGPDPAHEQEDDERRRVRRQYVAEVRLRAGELEDGERQCDVRERAADERDRPAGEEEAELALAQRAEVNQRVFSQ